MSDLADHTAATSAGYKRVQVDRGAGRSPRYITRYEKPLVGEPGATGQLAKVEADSNISQADADTKAVTALNGFRTGRYGAGAAAGKGGGGGTLTFDLH